MSLIRLRSRQIEIVLFSTFLLSSCIGVASSQNGDVEKKFRDFEIVPDLIPKAPSNKLQVVYKDGSEVNLGEKMNVVHSKSEPSVSFDGAKDSKNYTLVMIDPDAPADMAQFLHWLVVNIPADDVSQGKIIDTYFPPGSVEIPKPHRYIFLLYEQPDGTDVSLDPVQASTRTKFDVQDFAKTNGLGDPAAGNFFREVTGLKPDTGEVGSML